MQYSFDIMCEFNRNHHDLRSFIFSRCYWDLFVICSKMSCFCAPQTFISMVCFKKISPIMKFFVWTIVKYDFSTFFVELPFLNQLWIIFQRFFSFFLAFFLLTLSLWSAVFHSGFGWCFYSEVCLLFYMFFFYLNRSWRCVCIMLCDVLKSIIRKRKKKRKMSVSGWRKLLLPRVYVHIYHFSKYLLEKCCLKMKMSICVYVPMHDVYTCWAQYLKWKSLVKQNKTP